MSNYYEELKKMHSADSYTQKNYIPINTKRKYRKKNKKPSVYDEFSYLFKDYAQKRAQIAERKSAFATVRLNCVFTFRLVYLTVFCIVFVFTQYIVAFAGAISVPREARETAENAKIAAQSVIDKEQAILYRLNMEEYVEDATELVNDIGERIKEAEKVSDEKRQQAEKLRAIAQVAKQNAQAATKKADSDREAAVAATAAAKSAYDYAAQLEDNAKNCLKQLSESAAKKLEELDLREEDVSEKELRAVADYALQELDKLQEESSAAIVASYEKADRLNEIADALELRADQSEIVADEKNDLADLAEDEAVEAEGEALIAKELYSELIVHLYEARADEREVKNELAELIRDQNTFTGSQYASSSVNYYSWKDSQGNSGHQIVKPFFYGATQKDYSYGISTSHINSSNNSAVESGSVDTFTDVTIAFDKRKENEKYIYNYGVTVSLPTGKPTLSESERYAAMSEDLVELGQFGKGWQITPRFDVSKKISKEDTLTFGTSYSFNGSYDPTSDIPNDIITPGSEWMKRLRWQHAGQNWQFVGEVIHTSSAATKVSNGNSYTGGNSWEQRLTYNRKLNDAQDIMFYYWRSSTASNEVLPTGGREGAVNYMGTMWSKKLDDKRTVRLAFDAMKVNGSHYSGMTSYRDDDSNPQYGSVSVDGRTKYSVGAIYDHKINDNSQIRAELQKFTMKDGAATNGKPPSNYNGINVLVTYSRSF